MKTIKPLALLVFVLMLTGCASGYRMIEPTKINYLSSSEKNGLKLEYKYNLLEKRYFKKETKKSMKVAALRITNNSNEDYTFGNDLHLTYANGNRVNIIKNERVFAQLKQGTPIYLLYLLMTPMTFDVNETDSNGVQETQSSTPIGLIVGPGLAAGNMIAAGSANKKFKEELTKYDLWGKTIKKGDTVYGIIGMDANSNEALHVVVD